MRWSTKLSELAENLRDEDVVLKLDFNPNLHDREIRIDTGWVVKIGRGLDIYPPPRSWFELRTTELSLRSAWTLRWTYIGRSERASRALARPLGD